MAYIVLLRFFLFAFLIFSGSLFSFAQTDEIVRLWDARSGSVTDNLQIEVNKSDGLDKSVGLARLGEVWWIRNSETGRGWFTQAVDYATSPSANFKDDTERLTALRELLKVVASKDSDLAQKLARKLLETARDLSEKDEDANNDAILKAATELINVDVKQAFALASLTLKSRRPIFSISSILFSLRLGVKNRPLTNDYFALAVDVARAKPETTMFENLIRLAIPNAIQAQYDSPITDANRRKLLESVAIRFAAESIEALEGRRSNCSLTSFFAVRLRPHYELLLPEKVGVLDQSITVCRAKPTPESGKESDSPERPATVNDLLDAAARTSDLAKKSDFLLQASVLAAFSGQHQVAFDTLFLIDERHRSTPFGLWEGTLLQSATPLIVEQIRADDFATANNTLLRIPSQNRPLIRIAVASRLDKHLFKSLLKNIVDAARTELAKVDFDIPRNSKVLLSSPELYCDLVELYRELGFSLDAVETHDESIAAINRYLARVATNDQKPTISSLPIKWARFADFDGEILDTNFLRIENSLSKIDYAPVRREIGFAWLKTNLKRLIQVQEEAEKIKGLKKGSSPTPKIRR